MRRLLWTDEDKGKKYEIERDPADDESTSRSGASKLVETVSELDDALTENTSTARSRTPTRSSGAA